MINNLIKVEAINFLDCAIVMAQISTQICRMCSESNGIFYCYECQHALCTICRERHDMIPATSGHTITNTSTIDLAVFSKKSQCPTHDKEFLFFCVKCSDFICSKCVISTHKDHSFSGIAEAVSEEREHAKQQITCLKAKMEAILSIQIKVRSYIDKLNDGSKSCIETINSSSKDLHTFIERRKNIKITEVEDNKVLEQQNYESFMKNNEVIYKQYTQIISELENILPEKHDITFHSCYGVINIDIQNLVDVPDEPSTVQLHSFENKVLYKEIIENLESKSDESLCRSCKIHQTRIDQLLKENIVFQKELQRCAKLMTQKDEEIHNMRWTIVYLKEKEAAVTETKSSSSEKESDKESDGSKNDSDNEQEGSENDSDNEQEGSEDITCYSCGQYGHFARDCMGAHAVVCYNCHYTGHYSRDCPNRVCFKCGQLGHIARDCFWGK